MQLSPSLDCLFLWFGMEPFLTEHEGYASICCPENALVQ